MGGTLELGCLTSDGLLHYGELCHTRSAEQETLSKGQILG